ncbi:MULTISPECIES: DUF3997 domain-containing protein [Flavobacteriaceae]|uniref:DUF3997 domain-containing protein n=1 Tax=Flavobacteriaceae TaxID=49546 RepID=UPI0002114789|nr:MULTISPECIES: DUF3997 domain-containing protein [Flavobacteriaceae]AEH02739.1 hypothetical protein Lacal_2901 [Lacinutrix sp. 5H-3-7-4]WQG76518.1 DUF3997 domain-containing protein [Cellulophaga lytica]SNQ42470.1 conserved exported hypothetical protein [Cellulophaga lytica]
MTKTLRITKIILTLIGILTLNSCWNNPGESELIIGNYFVEWNDLVANRALVEKTEKDSPYSSGIISNYVFAVGNNSDFIIAKQHPYLNDLTITKYFIIDLKKREKTNEDGIYGPMDKQQFDKKSKGLNISELDFDQVYNENPN